MMENIEWGEWVVNSDNQKMIAETRQKLCEIRFDGGNNLIAYRIGTVKPVVTTQVLYWRRGYDAGINWAAGLDTHRITMTLHDGKPVGIAIEELK